MDEALIQGLIVGAVLGLVGFIADMVWKLIRSPSEGARRFKIVGGIALVLLVGSMMVAALGPMGALGTTIVIAAIVWVFKGFKKNGPMRAIPIPTEPRRSEPEPDATEPSRVTAATAERKTVITCPNCAGRLRVVAGKYIDATCPHCKTVFRTHT